MLYASKTTTLSNGYSETCIASFDSKAERTAFIAAHSSTKVITAAEKNKTIKNMGSLGNPVLDKELGITVRYF